MTETPSSAAAAVLPAKREGETPLPVARITVPQYLRMVGAGVWEDGCPELLDGVLLPIMPISGPLHAFLVAFLAETISEGLPSGWSVRREAGIELGGSVLAPDLAVVRGTIADYRTANPTAADVALLIEVSDSTMARDRRKMTAYAAAGVSQAAIVDVNGRRLIAYSNPSLEGYGSIDTVQSAPVTVEGQTVATIEAAALFDAV